MTSFSKIKLKIIFFSPPGGARELKLRPFDSESKTTSGCSNSLISKKITPNSLFSFYHSKVNKYSKIVSFIGFVYSPRVNKTLRSEEICHNIFSGSKKRKWPFTDTLVLKQAKTKLKKSLQL